MTLRVLFVGLGGVGQRHLRNLKHLLGPELKASAYRVRREDTVLTDHLTIEAGDTLEHKYNLQVFDDLDRALAEQPQLCVIANPSSMHVPVALRAIEAGADLFIEKPLSADLQGISRLIESAESRQAIAFVAYQLRFHPAVVSLIEAVNTGICGTIYGASVEVAEYLPAFHPYEDYRRMYASRSDLGGGVIVTQIHEIDLLHRLFGQPESVYCIGGKVSDLEVDVEDSASSLLKYRRADGTAWAVTLHQDYLGRPPRRRFEIHGARGSLTLSLRQGTLVFMSCEGTSQMLCDASEHPRNELFLDEMRHFLECTRTRTQPCVTLQDGAESLKLALALKRSQQSGNLVKLES